jgi:hypothetical protein
MRELILRYNRLGAETIRTLCSFLAGDEYMRVVDLRGNAINEDVVVDEVVPDLKVNKTLTNLDLRENPGYTTKVRKLVALCLLRNLERLKKSSMHTEKNWINTQILLPVEASLAVAMDPHMIDTVNIDTVANALSNHEDKRPKHKRVASKLSPVKKPGEKRIRPITAVQKKNTRNPSGLVKHDMEHDDQAIRLLPTYSMKGRAAVPQHNDFIMVDIQK